MLGSFALRLLLRIEHHRKKLTSSSKTISIKPIKTFHSNIYYIYVWNKTYSSLTENFTIKTKEQLSMGNSLSGFLAEIFMSSFAITLKAELWFPRI